MPSLTAVYSLLPFLFVVLLMLQGISILARSNGSSLHKCLGTLSILMAAAILLTAFLTLANNVIFSPEFLMLIGYGRLGIWSLVLLLSVGAGIGWHAALRYLGWPSRLSLLLLTGSALGLIIVLRKVLLIADYDSRLPIFAYNLGWVPWNLWLMGWVAAPVLPNLNVRHVWQTASQQWTTESWQGKIRFILSYMFPLASLFLLVWIPLDLLGKLDPIARKPEAFIWGAINGSLYAFTFILSWFIWMEFAVQVGLRDVSSTIIPIVTPLLLILRNATRWVMDASGAIFTSAKTMTEVNSVWSLVGKILIGILVLIVINELPNVGKTVIVPLQAEALTGEKEQAKIVGEKEQAKIVGKVISERVINRLGMLKRLETDIVSTVAGMTEPRKRAWSAEYITPISTTDALTAALSKSPDIPIGPVPIPLNALLASIQTPIRLVLGIREVSGSLHMEDTKDKKNYTLLVTSTTGQTWRVTHHTEDKKKEEKPIGCSGDVGDSNDLDQIADQLAFYILATDTTLKSLGMTESWEAYRLYIAGMDCLKRFKDSQRYGDLTNAIDNFRKALQNDPIFALAYFRLGYALALEGQTELAVTELRKSVKLTENFYTGTMFLASMLQQLDTPIALSVPMMKPKIDENDLKTHREEAKTYWLQVVSAPRRAVTQTSVAAAYLALCQDAGFGTQATTQEMTYLAYFFCRNSINLSVQYPSLIFGRQALLPFESQEFSAQTNQVLAYALLTLGELLMQREENTMQHDLPWHCRDIDLVTRPDNRRKRFTSPHLKKSVAYYETAKAVMPTDPTIKCYAAAGAYALGKPKPMEHLGDEAEAHVALADAYRQRASDDSHNADSYYSRALDEYQEALDKDRWSFEALNGFAYTMWEWRLKMGVTKTQEQYFPKALPYAKRAVTRAEHMPGDAKLLAQSSRGELLLAQGSFVEAQKYLTKAYYSLQQPGQDHANYDIVRWDLAQALLCSNSKYPPVNIIRAKAWTLLEKVKTNDNSRESKRFNDDHLKMKCALPLKELGIK